MVCVKQYATVALLCVVAAGCVSHKSFRTLNAAPPQGYGKILVVSKKPGIEKKLINKLAEQHVESIGSRAHMNPQKGKSNMEMITLAQQAGAQAVLQVDLNPFSRAFHVPEHRYSTVDYYTTEKHGKVTLWKRTTTTKVPAHTAYNTDWNYHCKLLDGATGCLVWEGNLTALFRPAYCNGTVAGKMIREMKKAGFISGPG
ncbi:MAG TPA: hypothetical protein PLI09_17865 [Candidatus Hydrogenedentes bacterium]|nr:hypothetical protein [Candidatus Hydrogenedentota bacterium]